MKNAFILCTAVALLAPATLAYEYALDDGAGYSSLGPSEWDAEMLWGNYYDAEEGYETITSISVSFAGDVPLGREVTAVLFDDPDDDLDPTNAIPLAVATGLTTEMAPNEFMTFDIEDTVVDGGFFVAATMFLAQHDHGPRLDTSQDYGRSWVFFFGEVNLDDLGSSPWFFNLSGTPFAGSLMVRAQAIPEPASIVCLVALATLVARRRR